MVSLTLFQWLASHSSGCPHVYMTTCYSCDIMQSSIDDMTKHLPTVHHILKCNMVNTPLTTDPAKRINCYFRNIHTIFHNWNSQIRYFIIFCSKFRKYLNLSVHIGLTLYASPPQMNLCLGKYFGQHTMEGAHIT